MQNKTDNILVATRKIELLAPAGSLPAFFAAISAGADAVYCGLKIFSARAKAKNFEINEIISMVSYAHQHNRKVYVALNTLIKESEIDLLISTISQLQSTSVDGIIIQDLALWRLVKRHFPELPIHASTQMTVHNAAGVNFLAGMGFKRVVLARELSLREIKRISAETDIELEHFVHGALCFSISGQCYFSSYLSGKSGNRGCCNQPCRRRYNYRDAPGYFFSTSDLCSIDYLSQLSDSGVTTFKIEGRMKSAEYVGRVVSAYRMVLDAPERSRHQVLDVAKQQLELSFGRRSTAGFLDERFSSAIIAPSEKGTIGQYLGQVMAVRGAAIQVKLEGKLHIGDRLKVMPGNDHAGIGLTALSMQINHKKVKMAAPGAIVSIETQVAKKVSPEDAVYKVSAELLFPASEARCRKKLQATQLSFPSLDLTINITRQSFVIKGDVSGINFERIYSPDTSRARDRPLDDEILRRIFAKTGKVPFKLDKLIVANYLALFIPISRLNEIRRDFFLQLAAEISSDIERKSRHLRQKIMAELSSETPCNPSSKRHLTVTIRNVEEVSLLDNPLINRLAVPLNFENIQGVSKFAKKIIGYGEEILWSIPSIIYPGDWQKIKGLIEELLNLGFNSFVVNNISHFSLFDDFVVAKLICGIPLYSLNSEAIKSWADLGVSEITMPVESDRHDLAAILSRKGEMGISLTVYAPIPLMTSRISVLESNSDTSVYSDRGERLNVTNCNGLTVISEAVDFSLLGHLAQLPVSSCTNYNIDLSHCGPFSSKGRTILEAFAKDLVLPETTTFNFYRGL